MKKSLTIFVTATNTDIGKTYISVELIKRLSSKYKVAGFKPIETGVTDKAPDTLKLYESSNISTLNIDDCIAYKYTLPAAPYIASKDIEIEYIKNKLEHLKSISDIVVVEGAGGLMVPIKKDLFYIDLINILGIDHTLLVTPSSLGCINDTMLSINLLKSKGISFDWCVNKRDEDFEKITKSFFDDYFKKYFVYPDNFDELVEKLKHLNC
ncbi:MAG: Dethiobiotin synthetase (EC [uncultured Campylobacterales bacterium]|uniref:ATP-dependent dethiobiotin synthetase BioD n=1 Tax=uncultured Campylobacterales bacterium TaxID=352960 RepID=A0A6S6TAX8_9BACT|nr:MAG: Dethiobiotin synthetase (EC [uncultured Campylobacterales bacterium]